MNEQLPNFPPWPSFEPDEIQAVVQVLQSGKVNYWTGGEGRLFEKEFAQFTGCNHAIALANGTLALEGALLGLGIGPGDEVIVPCRSFMASVSCVVMRGARPVMADIDLESQNITVDTIQTALTPKTRAIIAVHLAGWPCDMDPIMQFARQKGLKVIEDCAQAIGATYKGRPVGSLGDVAAFSFCQDKIMTTGGEGGMLTTDDKQVWEKVWSYKDHGKSFRATFLQEHPPGFRWLCDSFGTNWRLTEMQSAIGRVVLPKVPAWVDKRRNHAAFLNEHLTPIPGLRLTIPPAEFGHSYYKYYAFVQPGRLKSGWDRNRIIDHLHQKGVPCLVGSCSELYLEKAFPQSGFVQEPRLPHAKVLGESSLMFLVHHTITAELLEKTAASVKEVMQSASA